MDKFWDILDKRLKLCYDALMVRHKSLKGTKSDVAEFLMHNDMLVYIVVFDKDCFQVSKKLIADITEYIDENYVETHRNRTKTQAVR